MQFIREPEISGELASRPGINQVWAGIEAKRRLLLQSLDAGSPRHGNRMAVPPDRCGLPISGGFDKIRYMRTLLVAIRFARRTESCPAKSANS